MNSTTLLVESIVTNAHTTPNQVAVDSGSKELSYAQLLNLAAAIANKVPAKTSKTPLVVISKDSAFVVAAVLASWRRGQEITILDPYYPTERLTGLIKTIKPDFILTDPSAQNITSKLDLQTTKLLDFGDLITLEAINSLDSIPNATWETFAPVANSIAVWIFTSGSTGEPKGVGLSHETLANSSQTAREMFRLTSADRVASFLIPGFSAGLEVIFATLSAGATLFLQDPRGGDFSIFWDRVLEFEATTLHLTPPLLKKVPSHQNAPNKNIRLVSTCGEAVLGQNVAQALAVLPAADFVNYIGSSETGQIAAKQITAGSKIDPGYVIAGSIVNNKQAQILNENGQEVAPGEVGHLAITSAYLFTRYFHEGPVPGAGLDSGKEQRLRQFVTADLASFNDNDELCLHGRKTQVVKVRGYLVELNEIKKTLELHPQIADAAVAHDEATGSIHAFVVPHGNQVLDLESVKADLAQKLPTWMWPQGYQQLQSLPVTERGKVDLNALQELIAQAPTPVASQSKWTKIVQDIWAHVLRVSITHGDPSFFELGGDSLAIEECITILQASYGLAVSSLDLALHPRLGEFAQFLEQKSSVNKDKTRHSGSILLPFKYEKNARVVVCISGAGGHAVGFVSLAEELQSRSGNIDVLALQVQGLENRAFPDWSIRACARRYAKVLQKMYPKPGVELSLVGHSMGGFVAIELANMLQEATSGLSVSQVTILDSVLPSQPATPDLFDATNTQVSHASGQSASQLWKTRWLLLGAGILNYKPAIRKEVFFQHGLRLVQHWKTQTWTGPTSIFLISANSATKEMWAELTPNIRCFEKVATDHLGVLRKPVAGVVAGQILATLSATQNGIDSLSE